MRTIITILLAVISFTSISAQPAARRKAQQEAAKKSNADNITVRAKLDFPTALPMSEDVVWRRDIYRKLDLTKQENAGLYYPTEPNDGKMNLFTNIFKLMMSGLVPVYEYTLDGNESFDAALKVKPKDFLDNYHVYYEKVDGRVRIDNSDIPSKDVTSYYIKESAYYDQANSTFHRKVVALCPVMVRDDDFGDGGTSYPLFWIKYDDIAPYLSKQTMMTSDKNNAAVMSVDDYFTMNMYKGEIYKTNNMLGKTLAQYCPTDSLMAKEQRKIEKELLDFEKNIFGNQEKKDSLDSIAAANSTDKKSSKKNRNKRERGNNDEVKEKKSSKRSSSNSSSSARVTVRRQRH